MIIILPKTGSYFGHVPYYLESVIGAMADGDVVQDNPPF